MSCWNGAYMMATRIWPPMPMAMPTRSTTPEAHAEVADEVPRPLGPAGQPRCADEADPEAEQRGHDVPLRRDRRRGDGRHLRRVFPAMEPGDVAEDQRRRSGRPGSRRRRRRARSSPGASSAGGPTGYRGRGRRRRAAPRAGAAASRRSGRRAGAAGRGRRRGAPWRPRLRCGRRRLDPFEGHVPVRDRPRRPGWGPGGPGAAPPGSESVIGQTLPAPAAPLHLQGDDARCDQP